MRQTDTQAVAKIERNETCLQPGDPKVTKHVLKKLKWNPTRRMRGGQMVHGDKIYFML